MFNVLKVDFYDAPQKLPQNASALGVEPGLGVGASEPVEPRGLGASGLGPAAWGVGAWGLGCWSLRLVA